MAPADKFIAMRETRQTLNSRVLHLEQEILHLKNQCNEYTPIALLPTEILCRIFQYCRVDCWNAPPTYKTLLRPHIRLKWITVTHVCRHWRDVALTYSGLWSHLSSSMPLKALRAMVKRSKGASLTISVNDMHSANTCNFLFDTMSSEAGRLKTARIAFTEPGTVSHSLNNLTLAAPSLTELSVTVMDMSTRIGCLPVDFLAGSTPSLRKLEISRCFLQWNSTLYQGLTSLRLALPPPPTTACEYIPRVSSEQLAELLSNMPDLTHLDLEMEFPDMTALSADRFTVLASLLSLRLSGACTEVAGMLGHLRIPDSARVQLRCATSDQLSLECLRRTLQRSRTISGPDASTIRYLQIMDDERPGLGINLRGFATAEDKESMEYILSVSVVQRISWAADWSSHPLPAAQNLLRVIPWDDVQAVEVSCSFGRPWDKGHWAEILETMKPIKSLLLTFEAAAEFVRVLGDSILDQAAIPLSGSGDQASTSKQSTYLPYLQSLIFRDVNVLRHDVDLAGYGAETREMTVTLQQIIGLVEARASVGAPTHLRQLEFAQCRGCVCEAIVNELMERKMVEEIIWDGQQHPVEIYDWERSESENDGINEGYEDVHGNEQHETGDESVEEAYWFNEGDED